METSQRFGRLSATSEAMREFDEQVDGLVAEDPSELPPLEEVERRYILRVIEACRGNKSQAARTLGIGRKTLYRRLESMGIATTGES